MMLVPAIERLGHRARPEVPDDSPLASFWRKLSTLEVVLAYVSSGPRVFSGVGRTGCKRKP